MYRILISFFLLFIAFNAFSQVITDTSKKTTTDTLPKKDSAFADTVPKAKVKDFIPRAVDTVLTDTVEDSISIDTFSKKEIHDSLFNKTNHNYLEDKEKFPGHIFNKSNGIANSKEILFYAVIVLLLFFAFLNRLFPKYFTDLYRLFFRTTLNQSQIREQMMQSPLPSLLLNFFFVLTAGMYLNFIFHHYDIKPVDNFWLLFLYCGIGIAAIYFIKYLGLKFSGWIFHVSAASDSYIFIVFVINKMIGVFLLPIIIVLAFTNENIYKIGLTFSYIGIGAFLIYRLILTYASVRNQIKVSPFHFILYITAFEILPLFVIYKLLLVILERTA